MSQSMHIVTLSQTGHILAAVVQTTPGEPELEDLVGSDLPLSRTHDQTSTAPALTAYFPAEVLELKSVPFDGAVVANPHRYVVDGGRIVRVSSVGPSAPTLTESDITVSGTAGVVAFAVVSSRDEPLSDRRVQSKEVPAGESDVAIPLSVLPDDTAAGIGDKDDYDILLAVAGMPLTWFPKA